MVPTVGTVSRQLQGVASALQGMASHVYGLRNDIDNITERQKTLAEDVAVLRKRLCDEPVLTAASVALTPAPSAPRPSLAAAAGKATVGAGRNILMALGALGVAAQIAAIYRPGLVAPLQTLIDLLQQFAGRP